MMLRHVLRRVFPFGVLLYLLYVQYAYCYVVCKQNIYDSGWHAAGVGLIVGEAVLVVLLLASWALMFVAGPGSLPVAVPPYNLNSYYANGQLYVRGELDEKSPSVVDDAALIAPPQIFLCNADGLPFWCAQCRSIKTLRAHHSSAHGRCIPRFDHYCLYIGTIVAQNNYVWFLCFVSCFEMLFFYILVSTFAFSKAVLSYGRHRILHPAALLMIVVNELFTLLLLTLNMSIGHIFELNETSIDFLQLSRARQYRYTLGSRQSRLKNILFRRKITKEEARIGLLNSQRPSL
ncbi:uncharacterized protein OGAPODRAFT_78294 [Ogataea polymorpha]|uniref:uncharacterized protein n=1 Tax=Ogataea polymorpha TaxID=460523 RepID=UPI0007F53E85|nr:uncharacterized protein OGAPODRAFT_78294 [Ogataea polymorpha]OBA13985.1 hypothetical protein OGAPODRAFT_78294 [Ogataea polymorpha]